jgi:hypothetical protein
MDARPTPLPDALTTARSRLGALQARSSRIDRGSRRAGAAGFKKFFWSRSLISPRVEGERAIGAQRRSKRAGLAAAFRRKTLELQVCRPHRRHYWLHRYTIVVNDMKFTNYVAFMLEVLSNSIWSRKKKTISYKVPLPKVERFGMNWRRDRSIHAGRDQESMSLNEETTMAVKKSEPAKKAPAKAAAAPMKKPAPKKPAPKKKWVSGRWGLACDRRS